MIWQFHVNIFLMSSDQLIIAKNVVDSGLNSWIVMATFITLSEQEPIAPDQSYMSLSLDVLQDDPKWFKVVYQFLKQI